jgi:hypothetical protein
MRTATKIVVAAWIMGCSLTAVGFAAEQPRELKWGFTESRHLVYAIGGTSVRKSDQVVEKERLSAVKVEFACVERGVALCTFRMHQDQTRPSTSGMWPILMQREEMVALAYANGTWVQGLSRPLKNAAAILFPLPQEKVRPGESWEIDAPFVFHGDGEVRKDVAVATLTELRNRDGDMLGTISVKRTYEVSEASGPSTGLMEGTAVFNLTRKRFERASLTWADSTTLAYGKDSYEVRHSGTLTMTLKKDEPLGAEELPAVTAEYAAWKSVYSAIDLGRAGKVDAAIKQLKKTLEAKPDAKGAWILLARLHAEKREFESGIKCLKRELDLRPKNLGARLLLVRFYRANGQEQEAAKLSESLKQELLQKALEERARRNR